jgi:hypothetical protein
MISMAILSESEAPISETMLKCYLVRKTTIFAKTAFLFYPLELIGVEINGQDLLTQNKKLPKGFSTA